MRVFQALNQEEIKQLMRRIKVDPCGIEIMMPKALNYLVHLNCASNITANILKQEMLSLGGDAAVAKGALTGKIKKTGCLIIGSLSQLNGLSKKLQKQPFGLDKLGHQIGCALNNYQKDNFKLKLGKYSLNLNRRCHIMGILNLTPDSFSGDGLYKDQRLKTKDQRLICDYAQQLIEDGADIIDIGGESSRPGAKPVALKEELSRIIPVIKILAKKIKLPISVDTYKPEVAKQALDHGALIVNDISGLGNHKMAKLVAQYGAGVVIMHMKGSPRTMQKNIQYGSLIEEIMLYLEEAIATAGAAGIAKEKIIIDPGIGFGKTYRHSLEILKKLKEFKALGRPILAGPSRKSFIGEILKVDAQERIMGTVAACITAANNGANLVRVHDVKAVKQALKVSEAINYVETNN